MGRQKFFLRNVISQVPHRRDHTNARRSALIQKARECVPHRSLEKSDGSDQQLSKNLRVLGAEKIEKLAEKFRVCVLKIINVKINTQK